MKRRPNDPVPPVTRMTLPSRSSDVGANRVECGLDVPDEKLRERANQSLPRLRAAYVQVVLTYAAGLPAGSPPNVDFIGRELQRQTDAIVGRPGARLLLGAVMVN